jgi:outer membrane murein-binding lipoprotein Lpp
MSDDKLDAILTRLDRIEGKVDQLDEKLDAVATDIRRGMSEGFSALQDQIDVLRGDGGGNHSPSRVASAR